MITVSAYNLTLLRPKNVEFYDFLKFQITRIILARTTNYELIKIQNQK